MSKTELLQQETIYFLGKSYLLFYKAEKQGSGIWDLFELRRGEWDYQDNIRDETILRWADEHKVLLEQEVNDCK